MSSPDYFFEIKREFANKNKFKKDPTPGSETHAEDDFQSPHGSHSALGRYDDSFEQSPDLVGRWLREPPKTGHWNGICSVKLNGQGSPDTCNLKATPAGAFSIPSDIADEGNWDSFKGSGISSSLLIFDEEAAEQPTTEVANSDPKTEFSSGFSLLGQSTPNAISESESLVHAPSNKSRDLASRDVNYPLLLEAWKTLVSTHLDGSNWGHIPPSLASRSKPRSCPLCENHFLGGFKEIDLRRHISAKHLKYHGAVCPRCSKRFKTEYNMSRHLSYMASKNDNAHQVDRPQSLPKAEHTLASVTTLENPRLSRDEVQKKEILSERILAYDEKGPKD